jgi:hypothetical protein
MKYKGLVSFAAACGIIAFAGSAGAGYTTLFTNEVLYRNQRLVANYCNYHLEMQSDGNLVAYSGQGSGNAMWWSNTAGGVGAYAIMQTDGNFVVYNWSGGAAFQTRTNGNPNSRLTMQSDGNLVLYRSDNAPLWWSNTAYGELGQSPCYTTSATTYVVSGYDRPGYDYTHYQVNPPSGHTCGHFCAQDPVHCKAWTWVPNGSWCWLKYAVPGLVYSPGMVSGKTQR